MDLVVDPEFADKIPPLTEEEYRLLEENILADGNALRPADRFFFHPDCRSKNSRFDLCR